MVDAQELLLIIASSGHYDLYEAIGAFLICGIAIAIVGFSGIFKSYWVHIFLKASHVLMLAGILLKFGIQILAALESQLGFILSMLAIYLVSNACCLVIALY